MDYFPGAEIYFPGGVIPPKLNEQKQLAQIKKETIVKSSPKAVLSPAGFTPSTNQTPSEKYGSRTKAGDVIFRYKCKDSNYWTSERENGTVWKADLSVPTAEFVKNDYKYMFQKTKEVSMALDYLVESTGLVVFSELQNDDTENNRGSLKEMNDENSLYLGRIRSDGKLSSNSVYFEGCSDYSDGHIVQLDLSAVDEYHIFPGQVAVIEGKNELAKILRVQKLYVPNLLPLEKIPITRKLDPLNIMVAVGPFTPADSLLFEAFNDLIDVITRDAPDICILIGPFIEASHKLIETGELTYEEMFQNQIDFLNSKVKELKTQILIVSSFKDVNGQVVFPTPSYSLNRCGKVTLLPDPAVISVGGINIGMTSTDILMHLSKNELANSTISGDRMGRLARHMLSQRNFYPLYPSDETVPVDVEHWIRYSKLEIRPHILIVPSDLRHFIKDLEGTIVVNPERVTKGSSGGTFARIQVDLSSLSESEAEKLSSISDFCVGEIVKI